MSTLTLDEIDAAAAELEPMIARTPQVPWSGPALGAELDGTDVHVKLELLQRTGTFKARGALLNVLRLDAAARARGIAAVSAGNHAAATAFAAQTLGTTATVVMTASANAYRVALCRHFGAELRFAPDIHAAFDEADRLCAAEGRYLVHPFEGPVTAQATATIGHEIIEDLPDAEAVVVPVGGGGLCAGVAAAVKLISPRCEVYGVEPAGADSLARSRAAGRPVELDRVATIADSLGAPRALPYSFGLCERYVDEFVTVTDDELRDAMALIFSDVKMAVEPACAAATAALRGPLRARLAGKRVVLLFCGSNIDWASFAALAGDAALARSGV